jgi:GntR family transcriptional regulator
MAGLTVGLTWATGSITPVSRTDLPIDVLDGAPTFPDPDGGPAHAGIARWLTDLIGRGDLVPGDRLPREDTFARSLGVSRMTLRQALATLEGKGMLERKSGRLGGTFVREPRIECDLTGMAGFTEQMRRANLRAGARVVSAATVGANAKTAAALSLQRSTPVHEIVRVRTARREPLAIERSYFPVGPFPDLLDHNLSGSLYAVLARDYGQRPISATESLEPVIARADESALLQVEVGTPLMLITRTAFTVSGLAVEFARDIFRADRIRIALRTGID